MASFTSDFLVLLLVGVVKSLSVVCQPHPEVFTESQSHVSTLHPGQFGHVLVNSLMMLGKFETL